jgi:hypothetical protein
MLNNNDIKSELIHYLEGTGFYKYTHIPTGRTTPVPPFASGSGRTSGSAAQASALPGLSSNMRYVVLTVY